MDKYKKSNLYCFGKFSTNISPKFSLHFWLGEFIAFGSGRLQTVGGIGGHRGLGGWPSLDPLNPLAADPHLPLQMQNFYAKCIKGQIYTIPFWPLENRLETLEKNLAAKRLKVRFFENRFDPPPYTSTPWGSYPAHLWEGSFCSPYGWQLPLYQDHVFTVIFWRLRYYYKWKVI